MPIVQNHHVLIATVLIANALALESLPIFLEAIMPASLAIIFSTALVVFFGEILPQAICAGPNKLKIAEKMSCVIKSLMCIFSCAAYPMGAFLDWLLGRHGMKKFIRKDLKSLVELHQVARRKKKEETHNNQADIADSEKPQKNNHNEHEVICNK